MTSAKISGFVSNVHSDATVSKNQGTAGKDKDAAAIFASMIGQSAANMGKTEYSCKTSDNVGQTKMPKDTGRQFEVREKSFVKKDISEMRDSTTFKEALEGVEKAFENGVKDILEEKLGVTEEQIEEAMSELGLNFLQLMNPTDLSQLVAKLVGTDDACELLLNENFADVMQSVDALTQSLVSEMGCTKEELMLLNSQLQELTEGSGELSEEPENIMNSGSTEEVTEALAQDGEQTDALKTAQKPQELMAEEVQTKPEDGGDVQGDESAMKVNEVIDETTPEDVMQEQNRNGAKNGTQDDGLLKDNGLFQQGQTAEFGVKNVQTQAAAQPAAYTQNVHVDEIMQQIGEFARIHFTQEATSMEMQLNPENLGKLYIHVSTTKEGNVTAQIAASNEAVKEILQTQMADLKTTLNQQGVKVDAVEVTVASHEFERNLEQNASGEERQAQEQEQINTQRTRRLFRGELDELSGLMSEEEALAAQIMKDHGNTMDVTA